MKSFSRKSILLCILGCTTILSIACFGWKMYGERYSLFMSNPVGRSKRSWLDIFRRNVKLIDDLEESEDDQTTRFYAPFTSFIDKEILSMYSCSKDYLPLLKNSEIIKSTALVFFRAVLPNKKKALRI